MSILKKLFGQKSGIEKRRAERKQLKEFFKIQLSIDGVKFRISDFSSAGIGLVDEGNLPLSTGKVYVAELVAYGKPKSSIRLKVVRRSSSVFGCEILDPEAFKSFEEDYLAGEKK